MPLISYVMRNALEGATSLAYLLPEANVTATQVRRKQQGRQHR